MYLSKVIVDDRYTSASVALLNPSYLHSLIQTVPFDAARKDHNVLYRIMNEYGKKVLYVQSDIAPNWNCLQGRGFKLENMMNIDNVQNVLCNGNSFSFSVIVNPISRKTDRDTGKVKKRFIETSEKRMSWFMRYAERNGFEVVQVTEKTFAKNDDVRKKDNKRFVVKGVEFFGVLKIINEEAFKKCFREGLGPEKAYGYGMMMLKRLTA